VTHGNGFSLSSLLPIGTLVALLVGGSWAVFQTQFTNLEKAIVIAKNSADHDIQVLTNRVNELEHDRIRYLTQEEFRQFETRIEDLKKRVEVIEATRPTADTLQTVSVGLGRQLQALETRVDNLSRSGSQPR
jgi:hypothetical protein